ncbi:MAG: type I DNA topoisomerase [Christensenellales bacterium]|jgi:DNA topoisomerase-1
MTGSSSPKETTTKKTTTATGTAKTKTPAKKKTAAKKGALVIVESPAKANTIGKFLGKNYVVLASNGHVRDLPKSRLAVKIEEGFAPEYMNIRGKKPILTALSKEAKAANKVYLATDPDREGEAISWHIANVLGIDATEAQRIEFNEITKNAVQNAIKNPRPINMDRVNAQQARRILDRLVGYKISPLLWRKVKKGLSAGRVQSVAMRIICDREDEIENFVEEEFWTLFANLLTKSIKKPFKAKFFGTEKGKIELKSQKDAEEVLSGLENAEYVIKSIKKSLRKRHAPAPFSTSSLQQDASAKLNFATKKTMLIAQQLYEGVALPKIGSIGLVTYIRTDSVRISPEAQQLALSYIAAQYGQDYVPEKPNVYKGKKGAQDAHEAIRPTNIELTPDSIKDSLTNDQYRLYRLIYNRFLASQMSEMQYEKTSVVIAAADYIFKTGGERTVFAGFTIAYAATKEVSDEEGDGKLPKLEEGDKLELTELIPEQNFTQPPPRYTEATLVKTLEENGIGRPSTYAPTISTIIDRNYVGRQGKTLVPSELGRIVNGIMKDNFKDIVDVEFTAGMEEDLDMVEEGQKQWAQLLEEFYQPFIADVEAAEVNIEKIELADEVSDVECDKCGAMMVIKIGRFGKFLACPRYPECRNAKPIVVPVDAPCPKCSNRVLQKKSKKGKIFYGCEKYPDCDYVSWDMPVEQKCSECGSDMVQKQNRGGAYILCTNKECKHTEKIKKTEKEDE